MAALALDDPAGDWDLLVILVHWVICGPPGALIHQVVLQVL